MAQRHKKTDHSSAAAASMPNAESNLNAIVALPVAKVVPDPLQPRKSFQTIDGEVAFEDQEALESLADDMRNKGQLQPIVVRQIAGGKYQVIMGERRWRAAKLNHERHEDSDGTVLAIVRNELADENLRLAQLSENLQRVNLTDLETATFLKNILEEYPSLKKQTLASILGKNPQYVSRILALVDPQWAHVVDSGVITYASLLEQFRTLPLDAQNALIESSKERGVALSSGDINKARLIAKGKLQPDVLVDEAPASSHNARARNHSETEIGLNQSALEDVTAFLSASSMEGESYQYRGRVENIAREATRIRDFGGDAVIPVGMEALNPALFEKREVKLTLQQLKSLLSKGAFRSNDYIFSATMPVGELKNAIRVLGGKVPEDDNQLVISLLKTLSRIPVED
jgi:ParB family chromosome partitioning protein